jgi:hypothetical protein
MLDTVELEVCLTEYRQTRGIGCLIAFVQGTIYSGSQKVSKAQYHRTQNVQRERFINDIRLPFDVPNVQMEKEIREFKERAIE